MFSSVSLFCLVLLRVSISCASPSVPVSTQAIVTTITAPTVSNSFSTSQTVFASTSTYEDIQTITTVDSNGNSITTTQDNGQSETVVQVTSNVVATIAVTGYVTFESTVGESTLLGPDPTTSSGLASTSAAATTATSPSLINVSPAPADSSETSTYVSLGITYAPVTTSTSSNTASTISSIASPSGSAYGGSLSSPTGSPHPTASSGLSVGAKAAVVIAVIVFCILLAILLFWLNRLRCQRKAIREQYPDGQAQGDGAEIFGFFAPAVGKPYGKETEDEKAIKMNNQPSPTVRELNETDLTPPATEEQSVPYHRPIPRRNPHSPRSPVSPTWPLHNAMPLAVPSKRRPGLPESTSNAAPDPFGKGFPRPLSRFPSHHARRSSTNITSLPQFHEIG